MVEKRRREKKLARVALLHGTFLHRALRDIVKEKQNFAVWE
jgi:hypothetical protein